MSTREARYDLTSNVEVLYSTKLIPVQPRWNSDANGRISWEWNRVRRSFRRKDRQRIFEELDQWNTRLKNCFERKPEIPSGEDDPLVSNIVRLFDQKRCNECRQNVQGIHEALTRAWNKECDEVHHSHINLIWHERGRGFRTPEHLSLAFPTKSRNCWQEVVVRAERGEELRSPNHPVPPPSSTTIRSNSAPKPAKIGRGKRLQITFLSSSGHLANPTSSGDSINVPPIVNTLGMGLISQLTDAKPTSIPHLFIGSLCSTVYQDRWRGYLSYDEPTGAKRLFLLEKDPSQSPNLTAISLRSLWNPSSHKGTGPSPSLSRRDRFSIAAAACWAVLYLCQTPWLDKHWAGKDDMHLFFEQASKCSDTARRHNALRFSSVSSTFRTTIPKPNFVSSDNGFLSSQIRHRVLFSLGVLLIELCLNSSFVDLRAKISGESLSVNVVEGEPPDDFEIANELNDRVYLDAGDSYGYAVQRCLRCEFPGRDSTKDFDHATFRKQFYIGVVAPIQATFEQQIVTS